MVYYWGKLRVVSDGVGGRRRGGSGGLVSDLLGHSIHIGYFRRGTLGIIWRLSLCKRLGERLGERGSERGSERHVDDLIGNLLIWAT